MSSAGAAGTAATFAAAARRLAGLAGVAFGWMPDTFWRATPDELGAMLAALAGDASTDGGGRPPDAGAIARLKELFPDG